MGGFEDNMDSRVPSGSASSASGYSLRSRGSSAKISPFCPRSSSKLSQSIIRDHMISHYKKVYSAKAAIDTSVPRSLLYSVKYNDQLKRGLKNGVRPQSAHSLSQRSRASCSPAQSRLSLQYDDSSYPFSARSRTSTPRPSTSFHPKNTVYPPFAGDFPRPGTLQTSAGLDCKSFQDPVQKTYSGDLLQKHAQRFTQEKPFTPRTLKTDKSSYLSKYRYYRAPHSSSQDYRAPYSSSQEYKAPHSSSQDYRAPHNSSQDSSHKAKQGRTNIESPGDERSQSFTSDHDTSENDFSVSHLTALRELTTRKGSEQDLSLSFPRVSYEGVKSQTSRSLLAEEEELKYLEFITAVTDDILSRGFISDSVIERVINRHIDMNRYHLNEGKMRHLLEVLRKDLKEPCSSPVNTLNFDSVESHQLKRLLQKDDFEETKEDLAPVVKKSHSFDYPDPILTSTLESEPARTFIVDPVEINEEKGNISPQLSKHNSFSEADIRGNPSDDENQSKESDELVKQLHEVGTALESLNVSEQSHCENQDSGKAAVSEDEF